jgi:NAD(P)H-hydrate epimerase
MARLMKMNTSEVQNMRAEVARRAADFAECTVVLKGAGTLIASNQSATWINMTGNPGMSTGGTGDVLGGMIASLAAQGLSPEKAACAGVYLHGAAGDEAALHLSEMSMTATDIPAFLTRVLTDLLPR